VDNITYFILFIFILGILNRLREFSDNTGFDSWWENSWFAKIKNQFWFKWFRSNPSDKHKRIYLLRWIGFIERWNLKFTKSETWKRIKNFSIPNHPAFYDGYHNFKSITLLVISVYAGIQFGWYWIFVSWLAWYVGQKLTYAALLRSTWDWIKKVMWFK